MGRLRLEEAFGDVAVAGKGVLIDASSSRFRGH